jgi:hypothetical protein
MAKSMRYRKKTSKNQKVYKMKGCSHLAGKLHKSRCPLCGKKGGSVDVPLAYTGQAVPTARNPFLAYMGQHGGIKLPYNDTNGVLAVIPTSHHHHNVPPHKLPHNANLNASFQKGGGVVGGPGGMSQYQPADYYANGTVGNTWSPSLGGWPGVDGVSSNRNFLSLNTYPNDPQTQNIINERSISNLGLFGGRRRSRSRRGGRSNKTKRRRGGGLLSLNSMLPSDILNPLRSASYSVQGSVAALQGRVQPPNPLPENSQLIATPDYNSLAVFQ